MKTQNIFNCSMECPMCGFGEFLVNTKKDIAICFSCMTFFSWVDISQYTYDESFELWEEYVKTNSLVTENQNDNK